MSPHHHPGGVQAGRIAPRFSPSTGRAFSGFSLIELLLSVSLLAILLIVLTSFTDAAHRAWREGQSRTETFQSARTTLELMSREITPAVVDTRTQFVISQGSQLTTRGALNVAPNSPAVLWMAPLGANGDMRCVGYYLYRDEARKFHRLKRIFISPTLPPVGNATVGAPSPYFPKSVNLANPRDPSLRTSPINADWFLQNWDAKAFDEEDPTNQDVVVSTAADGVVAFWIQPLDLLGNPIPTVKDDPNHPGSELLYNSAAYFQVATTTKFDNGKSFSYLSQTEQTMKGNRVPASVDITVVTLDSATLDRGLTLPVQTNVYETRVLNVEKSVNRFEEDLRALNIYNARTFTTRAKLINGN
ncbi:hypothetical protein [Verrucomicrobium sp. BvORR034]|uniref:PulJ/GspJ family protein n=1 Tax=Verrucomicrobium sp. BvORR034 TaxID=1396418 RepID=UPI000678D501|nr:hypothetical protein [Verrucomicrobium sp. BvORR034]